MRFVRLTAEAYTSFCQGLSRQFLPQMPEYGDVRSDQGFPVEYLGVVDGRTRRTEHVIGAGLLLIQPWKRVFQRALMNYGPTLDWENSDLVTTFFEGMNSLIRRMYPRVLSVQLCPLFTRTCMKTLR